jgi:hypothetical protein
MTELGRHLQPGENLARFVKRQLGRVVRVVRPNLSGGASVAKKANNHQCISHHQNDVGNE